jgi:hypothetical protein
LSDGLDILLALGVWVAPLALAWFLIVKDSQRPGPAHSSKAPSSFGQPHSAGALREEVEQHDMLAPARCCLTLVMPYRPRMHQGAVNSASRKTAPSIRIDLRTPDRESMAWRSSRGVVEDSRIGQQLSIAADDADARQG